MATQEEIKFHEEKHNFTDEKSFDYDQISNEIYLGTNMCCQIGFSRELLDKNIRGDISLEKERIDNPSGVDYFLWLPVEDDHAPTQKQMELGVVTIDFFVKNHIKLFCHCKNGHGRAPTLVIAYFMYKGMELTEAVEFVRLKRSIIHPNERQIASLKDYEKSLK